LSTETDARVREANAFLDALFANRAHPDKTYVQLWHKSDKASYYYTGMEEAAAQAVRLGTDVYVAAGLVRQDYGLRKRAKNTQIVGIPGLWIDIDVNGGPDDKTGACETLEQAETFAREVIEPTQIVHSGYGLQAWYLFEDPWTFGSEQEQSRAASLMRGFWMGAQERAKAQGFKLDATHDLARLMRVPGTLNGKGGRGAPVTGWGDTCDAQDGPRYSIERLHEFAVDVKVTASGRVDAAQTQVGFDTSAAPPLEKLEALQENSDAFKRTWNKTRTDETARAWTQSEWDLSLASQAAYAEWADQEIANLLIAYRRKHGEDPKNEQYYSKTIARAKTRRTIDNDRERRSIEKGEAQDSLAEQAESPTVDPDNVCALFSKVVGGPPVKELVQSNRDPKNAVVRLVLANGEEVHIGSMANLLNPDRFREAFATVTGHVMDQIKRGDWNVAVGVLLKTRNVREVEITTSGNEVVSWLSSYSQLITPDHNEAATRRDPFVKDGQLWIAPRAFADYVMRHLRRRTSVAEIEEVMSTLGFEPKMKSFKNVETDKRTSTREYYCAPVAILEDEGVKTDDPGTEAP
jgi:hypothetical protein